MTNINIEVPDELHKKAKIQCAIDEVSLKDFIIGALEEKLKKKEKG
jgi:predicted HicB family RNase H-like nuclease